LNASAVTVIASPGTSTSRHGDTSAVIESAGMLLDVGIGGGTPTPRKGSIPGLRYFLPGGD